MKISTTYTNEFTGEVFTDRGKCEQAERESKVDFINSLIGDMELIKNICNSHNYCDDCPFEHVGCLVSTFANKYIEIVRGLQEIND